MTEAWLLVGGYALGTLQVLVIDWVRRRREHKKNLRTLRAELERALTLGERFRWEGGIEEDVIPKPPEFSPAYVDVVTSTDFYLTDEFEGDNAQQVFLSSLDGCDVLLDTHTQIRERVEGVRPANDDAGRARAARELLRLAESYNEKLGRFEVQLQSCLDDIERRLEEARYLKQLRRDYREVFSGGLPEGENPEPLRPGDLGPGEPVGAPERQ